VNARLATASKPESQDICFVSGTVSGFLSSCLAEKNRRVFWVRKRRDSYRRTRRDFLTLPLVSGRGFGFGGHEQPLYVIENRSGYLTVLLLESKMNSNGKALL